MATVQKPLLSLLRITGIRLKLWLLVSVTGYGVNINHLEYSLVRGGTFAWTKGLELQSGGGSMVSILLRYEMCPLCKREHTGWVIEISL